MVFIAVGALTSVTEQNLKVDGALDSTYDL